MIVGNRDIDPFGRPIERPLPWERGKMTVCIAAVGFHENEHCIVLCNDWKQTSAMGSAENKDKEFWLKNGWWSLASGHSTGITSLVNEYRKHLHEVKEIHDGNISEEFAIPLRNRKHALANEYISAKYGISYDEFRQYGKERFPELTLRIEYEAISRLELNAKLIIAGFTGNSPNICVAGPDVQLYNDWAVIGEGQYLASPIFSQRDHNPFRPLMRTLYVVYEAKKMAENVASVGEYTAIDILMHDGKHMHATVECKDALEATFKEIGPKPKIPDSELSAGFLQEYDKA